MITVIPLHRRPYLSGFWAGEALNLGDRARPPKSCGPDTVVPATTALLGRGETLTAIGSGTTGLVA